MDINVDVKRLERFGRQVTVFKSKMNEECAKLGELSDSFEAECSEAGEISAMLDQLQDILKNAEPDLNALAERVEKYAAFVTKTANKLKMQ